VWGEFFETVLNDADTTIFDRRPIRELISRQRLGLNNTHRLFALTMFELWRREYGITLA
jgi:asparagine synthase (glutamine-hydrolysing)